MSQNLIGILRLGGDESFGVFHGDDLIKVKLRFSKKVADRAKQIVFHKS